MGLRDLVLAQVLCVVGSSWVGVAAVLGGAQALTWVGSYAAVLFSDGGSGDRPQPDYAAGGRAVCLGA